MTLKMTSAQVVETSVIVNNNSSFQNYTNPDDHTQQTTVLGILANSEGNIDIRYVWKSILESPVSANSKCKARVVAYRKSDYKRC